MFQAASTVFGLFPEHKSNDVTDPLDVPAMDSKTGSRIACNLPDNALSFTNRVFLNPSDELLLSSTHAVYLVFKSGHCFVVGSHEGVAAGSLAMNSKQREAVGASTGFEVAVSSHLLPSVPSELRRHMVTCAMRLKCLSKLRTSVIEDDLVSYIHERFSATVFRRNQTWLLEMRGKFFQLVVEMIEVAPSDSKTADDSAGVAESADAGLLSEETLLTITPAGDNPSTFEWKKSANSMRSNILKPSWRFEDMGIGGLDAEFQTIFRRSFASRLFSPALIQRMGVKHVKGILLYGPPGTGKTLIARQIGKILEGRPPKIVNGPEVLNKYVGEAERKVRELFQDAEEDWNANGEDSDLHIIIFDEIDAICKQRGTSRDGTGVHDTLVNQLLSKIDGVDSPNNFLIIGMTNRKDLIDDALLRPGRLEVHVEIGLPDRAGRKQIFAIHTKTMRENKLLAPDVDFEFLADRTKNFSGAEIEGLVRDAMTHALFQNIDVTKGSIGQQRNAGDVVVTMADFEAALDEVIPAFGVADEELNHCLRGGIIDYGPRFSALLSTASTLVSQVRNSAQTPLLSCLLHGPVGVGKTALAARLAQLSEFPYVKIISPESFVGYGEHGKTSKIHKVFEDSYKSPLSLIVLDDIERLLEYVNIGPRFSNPILQTLLVLLKKVPPTAGRRLMIIGTTSNRRVLDDMELTSAFDVVLSVPQLSQPGEVKQVFNELGTEIKEADVEQIGKTVLESPVGIKQLLMLTEMAAQRREGLNASTFADCAASLGLFNTSKSDFGL